MIKVANLESKSEFKLLDSSRPTCSKHIIKQAILFLNTNCDLFKHGSGQVVHMLSVSVPPPHRT